MERGSYLRDMWNWLDFLVVVVGWLTLSGATSGGAAALRSIRVLRPLRTITRVRGMKVLVSSIITSIPSLANVFFLCLFFFTIFGIMGLQLFAGTLRNRCFTMGGELEGVDGADYAALGRDAAEGVAAELATQLASGVVTNLTLAAANGTSLARVREPDTVCGGDWMCVAPHEEAALGVAGAPLKGRDAPCQCTPVWTSSGYASELHRCTGWDPHGAARQCCTWEKSNPWALPGNPNYGITSFDAFHWALLTIFQVVTLEGWAYTMYAVQDGYDYHMAWLFFVMLVVLGSYFIVNLFIAVIYDAFTQHLDDRPPTHGSGSGGSSGGASGSGGGGGEALVAERAPPALAAISVASKRLSSMGEEDLDRFSSDDPPQKSASASSSALFSRSSCSDVLPCLSLRPMSWRLIWRVAWMCRLGWVGACVRGACESDAVPRTSLALSGGSDRSKRKRKKANERRVCRVVRRALRVVAQGRQRAQALEPRNRSRLGRRAIARAVRSGAAASAAARRAAVAVAVAARQRAAARSSARAAPRAERTACRCRAGRRRSCAPPRAPYSSAPRRRCGPSRDRCRRCSATRPTCGAHGRQRATRSKRARRPARRAWAARRAA